MQVLKCMCVAHAKAVSVWLSLPDHPGFIPEEFPMSLINSVLTLVRLMVSLVEAASGLPNICFSHLLL